MNTERDSTRIVQSWLEAGSTAIPDRVLDAVLAELPSRRQRRPRWSPWRSHWMKPVIPLAAGAAVVVLAVVLGTQFLPRNESVGGPTSSPTLSPTPTAVGGQFTFGGIPVDMEATSNGSSLSGTAVGEFNGDPFTITLQCLRQFDDQTWIFAGELTRSAVPDQPDGSWATVIVRDGSPQKAGIWLQERGTADDCEEFVGEVPDSAVEGPEMIGDLSEGRVALPPAPPGDDVSGQVTFSLGDTPVIVDMDASADGSSLSGTAVISFDTDQFTIGLECSRQFDDTTWIFGGTTTESTTDNSPVGTHSAVLVRDGEPQELILWFEDPPPADDCSGFVDALQDDEIVNAGFGPVTEGEISLP